MRELLEPKSAKKNCCNKSKKIFFLEWSNSGEEYIGTQLFLRKTYPAFASSKLCQFIQSLADIHILPQYSGQIEHLHQFKERNWIPAGLPITIDVFRELK